MCSVAAGLVGLQTVMNVTAQNQQTKAQVAAYNQQAQQAKQNAAISQTKQNQIAENYAKQQKELNSRLRLAAGRNAAQAGASGLTWSGSVLDLTNAAGRQYEEDSNSLLWNQRNDVRSEYINQVNYENAASQYSTAAKNAKAQGRMNMFSTILGGASSLYKLNTDTAKASGTADTTAVGNLNWGTGYVGSLRAGTLGYNLPRIGTGRKTWTWGY